MATGAELIAAERLRQAEVEGHDNAHDDHHYMGELSLAAKCYTSKAWWQVTLHEVPPGPPPSWPFDAASWKPTDTPIGNLVKAGALIAAEIDRLTRLDTF